MIENYILEKTITKEDVFYTLKEIKELSLNKTIKLNVDIVALDGGITTITKESDIYLFRLFEKILDYNEYIFIDRDKDKYIVELDNCKKLVYKSKVILNEQKNENIITVDIFINVSISEIDMLLNDLEKIGFEVEYTI